MYATSIYSFGHIAPIVSPQLVQDIISLTFVVPSNDDIKMDHQPFMGIDGMEEHQANNMEVARDYGFLAGGMVGISYESLMALRVKETHTLPVTHFDLKKCLGMFRNLIAVVLGDRHPLTQSYQLFWQRFNESLREKIYDLIDRCGWLKPLNML